MLFVSSFLVNDLSLRPRLRTGNGSELWVTSCHAARTQHKPTLYHRRLSKRVTRSKKVFWPRNLGFRVSPQRLSQVVFDLFDSGAAPRPPRASRFQSFQQFHSFKRCAPFNPFNSNPEIVPALRYGPLSLLRTDGLFQLRSSRSNRLRPPSRH